jgi:integrase
MAIGRPRLPLGTYGEITLTEEPRANGKLSYRAKARFRDADGVTRPVVRYGQSKRAAKDALRVALAERQRDAAAAMVTGDTTVSDLAGLWLALDSDWAVNTRETYTYVIDNQVRPQLGSVRLREIRPVHVGGALEKIRDQSGPGAAKTAKTVLTGMFDHAVLMDAMQANPAARVKVKLHRARKAAVRALSRVEEEDLCDRLRADQRAVEYDLPDLVEFMLGTALRIGEACAVGHADCPGEDPHQSLDLDAGTLEVNATLIRRAGHGLTVQHRTKTDAGWRVLRLPSFTVRMIERRRGEARFQAPSGVVFGAPASNALRDPSNTAGDLREVLDRLDYGWVTSHTFRKTALTRLDEAGLSARERADVAGHARISMTQDVYTHRGVVSDRAAEILDR